MLVQVDAPHVAGEPHGLVAVHREAPARLHHSGGAAAHAKLPQAVGEGVVEGPAHRAGLGLEDRGGGGCGVGWEEGVQARRTGRCAVE